MTNKIIEYVAETIVELMDDHIEPSIGKTGDDDNPFFRILYTKGKKEHSIITHLSTKGNLLRIVSVDKISVSQEVRLEDGTWLDTVDYHKKYGEF